MGQGSLLETISIATQVVFDRATHFLKKRYLSYVLDILGNNQNTKSDNPRIKLGSYPIK